MSSHHRRVVSSYRHPRLVSSSSRRLVIVVFRHRRVVSSLRRRRSISLLATPRNLGWSAPDLLTVTDKLTSYPVEYLFNSNSGAKRTNKSGLIRLVSVPHAIQVNFIKSPYLPEIFAFTPLTQPLSFQL